MKINRKLIKKIRKILNIYNIAILGCIILIAVSLCIIFKPNKVVTPSGITVVQTDVKDEEEITEEKARKTAVKQFKKLNEKVKEDDLNVVTIQREGEKYYYITSKQNSLEIKIKGGKVTRINAAPVEE